MGGACGNRDQSNPAMGRFVGAAMAALAADAMARVDRLRLDGRTLAAAIPLRHGEAAWFW
jgi:hypothetical protein